MPDRFENHAAGLESPVRHGFAITPDDSVALAETTRAIYVGTAGDISLILASGAGLTFVNLASGTVLPVRATGVNATGTTAADLLGLL